jgi:hypothetical protein
VSQGTTPLPVRALAPPPLTGETGHHGVGEGKPKDALLWIAKGTHDPDGSASWFQYWDEKNSFAS